MNKSVIVVYTLTFCVFIHTQAQVDEHAPDEIAAIVSKLVGDMVSIPSGSFRMGDLSGDSEEPDAVILLETFSDAGRREIPVDLNFRERPAHSVIVPAFKLGKHEVTFAQWDACVADGACNSYSPDDEGWGRGDRPVINVSWLDIRSFLGWLKRKTGRNYRLPSEAEWEYAARAGATTTYTWGDDIGRNRANCIGCSSVWHNQRPALVGSFSANAWGLHDMHGNVSEWVQDCWNDTYEGAPTDGSAWTSGDCESRVFRGGSWDLNPWYLRAAYRAGVNRSYGHNSTGFRLAHDQ